MRIPPPLLALAACLLPASASAEEAPPEAERFTLENGLRVILRPVAGATRAAVAVLYDFGEDADPRGKSGLAHLCEHLYCTAAAGGTKARTADSLTQAYPAGWNAQTGRDYTVFASVVPAGGLEAELADAAARMGALEASRADLDREAPRLVQEAGNMFTGSPVLAAANLARERLFRRPFGRRGGLPEEAESITLEEASGALARWYRPSNARLAVAGALDAAAERKRIEALFGRIPRGEPPARTAEVVPPSLAAWRESLRPVQAVDGGADLFGQGPQACVGWRAPRPGDGGYAEFLVLAVRLWTRSARFEKEPRERPRVIFAPLDDPDFLLVQAGVGKDEAPEAAAARIEKFVRDTIDPPMRPDEGKTAKFQLATFLGTMPLPDAMLAENPYGAAFALGRRDQLGVDGASLAKALDAVTDESLAKGRTALFAHRAAVVVRYEGK